jgi:hypothetical protein
MQGSVKLDVTSAEFVSGTQCAQEIFIQYARTRINGIKGQEANDPRNGQ